MSWPIADGHVDIAMALHEHPGRVFGEPAPEGQAVSLPDAQAGDVRVIVGTVFAPEGYWPRSPQEEGEAQMATYASLLETHADTMMRIATQADLDRCWAGERIGLIHLMEGADPIRSPDELPRWVERGVRLIAINWNTPNAYAGGIRESSGLTPLGFELLAAMRAHGVVPDLSHLSRRSVDQVLEFGDGLVVASHSNVDALHAHLRNLTGAHLDAVAARGGVVGVVLFNPFLGPLNEGGIVDIDTVVAHIDAMVTRMGPAHVGIGSDLDGGFSTRDVPEGIDSLAHLQRIGEALRNKGYDDVAIAGILGGNWIRVLRTVLPS